MRSPAWTSQEEDTTSEGTTVPQTPSESSRGSTRDPRDRRPPLADDGCPYTEWSPELAKEYFNGKPVMFPIGTNKLWPKDVKKKVRDLIEQRRRLPGKEEGGHKWFELDINLREQMFDELRKWFFIPNATCYQCLDNFQTIGSNCYRKRINKLKTSRIKPSNMSDPEWAAWLAYWGRKEVVEVSLQNAENRNVEPSDGKGVARHHFGSKSMAYAHMEDLIDGTEKPVMDLFKRAKYKEGKWIDKNPRSYGERIEKKIAGRDLPIEEVNRIFFEVNPMDDKGRVYGLGSLGPALGQKTSSAMVFDIV
ncbi:hypothetical protein OROGR_008939 [Orobanche gracilis]